MSGTPRVASALVIGALSLIYLPDIGHGFLRDDFRWIRAARVERVSDVRRIFAENVGFYRPVVTASFAVNRTLFGLRPFPYALTNFGLLLVCMWLMVRLGSLIGLTPSFALVAAALWALNFHGVNMALLWISGRTALLLCVFALAALAAFLRGRQWWAAVWCLLAMLSKEEAVVLPVVLMCWKWYSSDDRRLPVLIEAGTRTLPAVGAVALYVVLRAWSGAFGPMDAPEYYRFTFAPADVARNAAEYIDRACTLVILAILLTLAIVRRRPALPSGERRVVQLSMLWLVSGFALTLFLPIRSSLYALFPSIGSCLAGAMVLQAFHRGAPARVRGVVITLLVLAFALVPVYWSRNERWVTPADLSHRVVADLQAIGGSFPHGSRLLAIDDESEGLLGVFDGLFADAVTLYVDRDTTGQLVDSKATMPVDRDIVRLRLRGDSLVAEQR